MGKSKVTDPQSVALLREAEEGQATIEEVARKYAITSNTFYRWEKPFGVGGNQLAEVRRIKELEIENGRLKKALAEQVLAVEVLQEINAKKGRARRLGESRHAPRWVDGLARGPHVPSWARRARR